MRTILLLLTTAVVACSTANGAPPTKDQEWATTWMSQHCVATLIEPGKVCSLCQGEAYPFPKARAAKVAGDIQPYKDMMTWSQEGWSVVTKRLGGQAAVERGVTYCEKR